MEKCRVLHVINGMGTGGAEKDIMNWYRKIDQSKYQFDFLIRTSSRFYENEIKTLGGKLYEVSSFPRHFVKNYRETYQFLKTHRYDVVHVHGNALIYILPLMIAKRLKIKKRVMHIHSTSANGRLALFVHSMNRYIIRKYVTDSIACSVQAGKFGYKSKFEVVNNGVLMEDYRNVQAKKKEKRKGLNIEESALVFGSVARFLPVKNHVFIIDIFKQIKEIRPDSILILVGSGELKNRILERARSLKIADSILFLGDRDDVNEILGVIDLIIFPSLYEGVPLVPLEAQAAKTKVICSDVISDDIMLTKYIRKMSLTRSAKDWADSCLEFVNEQIDDDIYERFLESGYCMESVVEKIKEIYRRRVQ